MLEYCLQLFPPCPYQTIISTSNSREQFSKVWEQIHHWQTQAWFPDSQPELYLLIAVFDTGLKSRPSWFHQPYCTLHFVTFVCIINTFQVLPKNRSPGFDSVQAWNNWFHKCSIRAIIYVKPFILPGTWWFIFTTEFILWVLQVWFSSERRPKHTDFTQCTPCIHNTTMH